MKVTNECDKYFENKYTYGGYECDTNGKWSTKCVPSYCDLGYIFDYEKGKCIYDKCSEIEGRVKTEDDDKDKNNKEKDISDKALLIIIICSLALSIMIIIIFFIAIFIKGNKNDSDYGEIPTISLSIEDRNG